MLPFYFKKQNRTKMDKKNYITTRMREVDWVVVEDRVNKAEKIAEALR